MIGDSESVRWIANGERGRCEEQDHRRFAQSLGSSSITQVLAIARLARLLRRTAAECRNDLLHVFWPLSSH